MEQNIWTFGLGHPICNTRLAIVLVWANIPFLARCHVKHRVPGFIIRVFRSSTIRIVISFLFSLFRFSPACCL